MSISLIGSTRASIGSPGFKSCALAAKFPGLKSSTKSTGFVTEMAWTHMELPVRAFQI